MGLNKDSQRQKAENFFIENIESTQKDIAELFNVTVQSVNSWYKKYDWKEKRLDFHASPTRIKQRLQEEILNITSGGTPKFSSDSVAKLMSALDRCNTIADPIVVQKILKDLDLFVARIDPKRASENTKFHKMFLQHRIAQESNN
ncbi:hypothetical protein V3Q90_02075 [Flavobacterium oreochromis]|uniref:hypothetical protein n=1 Tax=Flavobacterium oreochromis TaxID=2906078 RepID=UPI00385CEAFE